MYLHIRRRSDVVDLQDHFHQLCGKLDLRLLTMKGFDHSLLFHIVTAQLHTVDSKSRIVLGDLL